MVMAKGEQPESVKSYGVLFFESSENGILTLRIYVGKVHL